MSSNPLLQVITEALTSFTPRLKTVQILPEHNMSGDLGLDSQEELELAFVLEDKLKIKLPPEEFAECQTIQDLISFIERKQAA